MLTRTFNVPVGVLAIALILGGLGGCQAGPTVTPPEAPPPIAAEAPPAAEAPSPVDEPSIPDGWDIPAYRPAAEGGEAAPTVNDSAQLDHDMSDPHHDMDSMEKEHSHDHFTEATTDDGTLTSPHSFTRDVMPMLRTHCVGCHSPGGSGVGALQMVDQDGAPRHAAIQAQLGQILLEIQAGRMPEGRPYSLTAAEFKMLDEWSAAGGPNN